MLDKMLTSFEIEKFIEENQPAVVKYYSKNHQGFDNKDPRCVGIIYEDDLFLVFESDFRFPKVCVESETRSQGYKGKPGRYMDDISELNVVKNPRLKREKLAQKVLQSIQEKTQLTKYTIYWTRSVNGIGINKELKFWFR